MIDTLIRNTIGSRIASIVVWLVLTSSSLAQTTNWMLVHDKTETKLKEIISSTKGTSGLVALDLTSGERFAINETLLFPQASAIKIPILMEVYKQATEGKFKLTDLHRIGKRDMVGGSGILNEFGDSTSELSVHDLSVLMILLSDNTATNILIDLVGMDNINRTLRALGLQQTRIQRKMLDQAASRKGNENLSTPAEAARIMETLYRGEFVNKAVCDAILSILKIPKRGAVNAVLPASVSVAFKPGELAGVSTEWAIVFLSGRPYVVIAMENYGLEVEGTEMMKSVSRILFDYY